MKTKQFKYGEFPYFDAEDILGTPLPEIDQVYFDAWTEFLLPGSTREDIAPYCLAYLFDLEEFEIARALPGTPAEVAEKCGKDEAHVAELLERLVARGAITISGPTYCKLTPVSAVYMDYVFFALDNAGVPIEGDTEKLIKLVRTLGKDPDMYPADAPGRKIPSRIIPKWDSIKDVPGTMDCENLKTIMFDAQAAGEFSVERCFCRIGHALFKEGVYSEEANERVCPGTLYEGQTPVEGHCLVFGKTAKHWKSTIGGIEPTVEDTQRVFDEINAANVIAIGVNNRSAGNICNCELKTCYPNGRFAAWDLVPSRFRPATDLEECVSCGKCVEICQVGAIAMDANGNPVLDTEKCLGCGNCVVFCTAQAKEMEIVHPVDWIPDGDVHLFAPPPIPASAAQ